MSNTPSPAPRSRVLRLSTVKFHPRNVVGACLTVDFDGYVGLFRAEGVQVVDEVSRAQGNQEKPAYCLILDHATNPDDVVAVPSMTESPDSIPIEWYDKGHSAKLNLAKLLTMKKITIPEGTRMVIDLYEENDPDYGACVGMKLMAAEFVPKKKGVPRKKKSEGTVSATQSAPAPEKNN